MNSYFFYYFSDVDGAAPFFEVANCDNNGHAVSRCRQLLKMRNAQSAEVWSGERRVDRLAREVAFGGDPAQLAANTPQGLASLRS